MNNDLNHDSQVEMNQQENVDTIEVLDSDSSETDEELNSSLKESHEVTLPSVSTNVDSNLIVTEAEISKKSSSKSDFLIPIFIVIILLFIGAFLLFINKDKWLNTVKNDNSNTENIIDREDSKDESIESEDSEIISSDSTNTNTDSENSKPVTSDSTSTNNNGLGSEDSKPVTSDSTSTNNNGLGSEDSKPVTSDSTSTNADDIEITPHGMSIYLYEDYSYFEMDGVGYEYISSTSDSITLDITIMNSKKRYVIPFGKQTRIDHLKNFIVIVSTTDSSDSPCFMVTYK